ncbi:ubinuclein-1-like [Boleophthalmus pectinirostris]|uniref:ubinuclein-1-like n=1 Tax=Boleophthalmus pectinirostris TaxID=150288 RepID=UPI00242D1BF9|nr:ubinuclein-1-like [Boleophthalmus pectinirostris]
MAEPRRVELKTLSSAGLFSPAPSAAAPVRQLITPKPPAEPCAPDTATVRLVLPLFEPDERNFPEFSYSQLLDGHSQKRVEVRLSRMEQQEQEELAHITNKLEEKYGGKPRPQHRVQDLIDIGYGYDDEDSFIDNSEAYDEFVPMSLTTEQGGFYVNTGLLHFRQASDMELEEPPEGLPQEPGEGPSAEKRKEASKRRKLTVAMDKPLKKRCEDDCERDTNPGLKKKKPTALSITSALRRCERERQKKAVAPMWGPSLGFTTLALGPADAGGGGCMSFTAPLHRLMGPSMGPALDSDVDCVLVSEDSSSTHSPPPTSTPPPLPDGALHTQGTVERTGTRPRAEDTVSQVCPEDFPRALEESILRLQMASKTSEGESKVKFYTPEINELLLLIDGQCRQHGGPHGGPLRSRVYSHLCSFLPCNKDTLMRRVNRLKQSRNEKPDEEQLMKTLKKAIKKTMPEQILSWKEMCGALPCTSVATQEEDESEERGAKKAPGPKKLFKWNDEIREGLRRLLKLRLEQFKEEHRAQEEEHRAQEEEHRAQEEEHRAQEEVDQYLSSVLEGKVKPLWPKGWMPSRILQKEARNLLSPGLVKKSERRWTTITPASCDSGVVTPGQRGVAIDTDPASSDNKPAHSSKPASSAPCRTHLQPSFQELLVEAVARYNQCTQRWGFSEATSSPPLPPPPPQSSPTNFPLTPLSALTPNLDSTKNM